MCVQYIGGCSVHRGVFSTSGRYHEYIGGISWVHWGVFSTSGGYREYIGGCLVHRRDTVSTSGGYHEYIGGYHNACGGYHEYIGGCSVHQGIPWVHQGISWVHRGDIMSTLGGYHEYIGGCSVHWGMFSTLGFSIEIEKFLPTCSPTCIMISPNVLNIPDVLMISPRCTHGIPQCTKHPSMYWTSPDVLNTHYTGCLCCSSSTFSWK